MQKHVCEVMFVLCTFIVASVSAASLHQPLQHSNERWKVRQLQSKLITLDIDILMEKDIEKLNQMQKEQQVVFDELLAAYCQLSLASGQNITSMHRILENTTVYEIACSSDGQMLIDISSVGPIPTQKPAIGSTILLQKNIPIRSCREELSKRSGKSTSQPGGDNKPFANICSLAQVLWYFSNSLMAKRTSTEIGTSTGIASEAST